MTKTGLVLDGKYRLVRKLGEGGMGAVFEANHLQIDKRVAVKLLLPQYATDVSVVMRFEAEAKAAAAVGHPGIIDVYDLGGASDGSPYLVMEYLEGQSLEDLLEERVKLDLQTVAYIVSGVLSALAAVHEAGIVHRDLKPDNIFLMDVGRPLPEVKLLDFGISKFLDTSGVGKLTKTGTIMGTPHYMSPEQARGAEDLDHRVDIYAVGAIMYECLTGEVPFPAKNYNAIMAKILSDPIPRVTDSVPLVPSELEEVILRAMEKDRTRRIDSAEALLAEVVPFVDDAAKTHISLPAHLRQLGLAEPTGSMMEPQEDVGLTEDDFADLEQGTTEIFVPRPDPELVSNPSRWPWIAGGLLLLTLLGAFVGIGWGGRMASGSSPETARLIADQPLSEARDGAIHAALPVRPTSVSEGTDAEPPTPSDGEIPLVDEVAPAVPGLVDASVPLERANLSIKLVPPVRWARIYIDGRRQKGPPYTSTFPMDGLPHKINVVAAGYHRWRGSVELDRDREVTVNLVRRRNRTGPRPSPTKTETPGRVVEDEDPWGE